MQNVKPGFAEFKWLDQFPQNLVIIQEDIFFATFDHWVTLNVIQSKTCENEGDFFCDLTYLVYYELIS